MTKNARHQATREMLLQVALKLILDQGLAKFSLRGLARESNYSPAGLYEYFKNKDEIISELSNGGFDRLHDYILQSQQAEDDLFGFGQGYLTFAHENAKLYQLIFNFVPSSVTSLSGLVEVNESFRLLFETVKAKMNDGRDDSDFESLAFSYWSLLHGLSILPLTIIQNYTTDFKQVSFSTLQVFIDGLLINKKHN